MSDPRRLRLGVVGLGRAFMLMLPGLRAHPNYVLAAAADPNREARDRFATEFGARVYDTAEALCQDPDLDAVYIATPHQFHAANTGAAATGGKHVLVEKPMALTLADCQSMIESCRAANVALVVGHSHSFDAPVRRARAIIDSGAVGAVDRICNRCGNNLRHRTRGKYREQHSHQPSFNLPSHSHPPRRLFFVVFV